MTAYIIRRLLLVIPTLIGIMTVNFIIIQIAPGGPVEQMIAQLQGEAVSATERLSGGQYIILISNIFTYILRINIVIIHN